MDTSTLIGITVIVLVILYMACETLFASRKQCPDCAKGCWESAHVCPHCGHRFAATPNGL